MNAVSPTRSTRTLPALSCWHSAGVAMANMMSKSKYEKSTELDGFKNGLHGSGSEPGPNFAGSPKMGRHRDRTPDLQKACRCQRLTQPTAKAQRPYAPEVEREPLSIER